VAPGARIIPDTQLLLVVPNSVKSAAFVPEKIVTGVAIVMLRLALVLVMVKTCAVLAVPCVTLPKLKLDGVTLMEAVPDVPVPASPAEAVAFAPTTIVAFLTPAEVGEKTTVRVQVEPTVSD